MSRLSSALVHIVPKISHRNRAFTSVTVFADARCPAPNVDNQLALASSHR